MIPRAKELIESWNAPDDVKFTEMVAMHLTDRVDPSLVEYIPGRTYVNVYAEEGERVISSPELWGHLIKGDIVAYIYGVDSTPSKCYEISVGEVGEDNFEVDVVETSVKAADFIVKVRRSILSEYYDYMSDLADEIDSEL